MLRWTVTRNYLKSAASGLSGSMPKIDQAKLASVMIPVPPLTDQELIVAESSRKLSLVDAAELVAIKSRERANNVRRSLLVAAFNGKLVEQDVADEPALVLWKRLQETRSSAQTIRTAARRSRSSKTKKEFLP